VVEEVGHVGAEGLVVAVYDGPGGWWSAAAGDSDTGDDGPNLDYSLATSVSDFRGFAVGLGAARGAETLWGRG
jgi:hypothetical protein